MRASAPCCRNARQQGRFRLRRRARERGRQMETRTTDDRAVSITLFTSLFAGQAALIAMAPVLTEAASDLDVSTAAAGQLRTLTGLTAGITALLMGRLAGRFGLGRQLVGASLLLALGSLASALAPSFALLALAQVPVGVAVAILTTAGTLAAAEWVSPEYADADAVVGARRAARGVDRRDAVDRPRRRAQLALRLARPALRRRRCRRSARRAPPPAARRPPSRRRALAPRSAIPCSRAGSCRSCS